MDDDCSVLSSCYWDATSITSDSTIPAEFYHTPIGSLLDMQATEAYNSESESNRSLTPVFIDLNLDDSSAFESQQMEREPESEPENVVNEVETETVEVLLRPPLIRQTKLIPEVVETINEPPKKKSWKHSLSQKLSNTRSRIMRSFSIEKYQEDDKQSKNIFLSVRHSIRRFKSFDRKSSSNKHPKKHPSESTSAILGSDCEHFSFVKTNNEMSPKVDNISTDGQLSEDEDDNINTPLKPRRHFSQEKYLTGSKDTLQKAYNSLKRKSYMPNDKSLFDICSTVKNVFVNDIYEIIPVEDEKKMFRKVIEKCVSTFLEVHRKQIESSLQTINKTLGEFFDLNSPNLEIINKSKKYLITEIVGSGGTCMITNCSNKEQFIALKTNATNWIQLTSFLQHIDKDADVMPNQEWICFPAQSITNVYIEKYFFSSRQTECQILLETIIQLVVLLYQRMNRNSHIKVDQSNILLITSHLSLIIVFTESEENIVANDTNRFLNIVHQNDKERRHTYQELVMKLNKYVELFLSSPENSSHFITASYPLDYLFYLLIKLNKDINTLIKSL